MPKPKQFSKSDPATRLVHILDSIEAIESYVAGQTLESFLADTKSRDAVERRLEIICEATKALLRLQPDLPSRRPDIPWAEISRMREKLAHDYDTINVDVIWFTVSEDLPPLKIAVRQLLQD